MSGAILTTSEMVKPDESCVVPTLGAMVAVLTDGYSNGTGIRVPVSISVGYPGFQIPRSPSTSYYRQTSTNNKSTHCSESHKNGANIIVICCGTAIQL